MSARTSGLKAAAMAHVAALLSRRESIEGPS
jgi:hypothetical protein